MSNPGRAAQKSKENLKSKLDGNQLDLSLNSLEVVPVKDLMALPKATWLDLSCNQLTSILNDFCILTHLVRLDLSKNQIVSLPSDFGDLQKLQHLDLYHNSLTSLPLSFSRLNALKWLDVRDNPLATHIHQQAGDCLNEAQCRSCAKQIVAYMKKCQSDAERERQKRLQEGREIAAAKKLEDELEKQRLQQAKKEQKALRRQELDARKAALTEAGHDEDDEEEDLVPDHSSRSKSDLKRKPVSNGGVSCCGLLLYFLIFIAGVVFSFHLYCTSNETTETCTVTRQYALHYLEHAKQLWIQVHIVINELVTSLQEKTNSILN